MGRLAALLRPLPWQRLVPDLNDTLVTAGGGDGGAEATAAFAPGRDLAVLYILSDGRTAREPTLDLSLFPAAPNGRWVNPARAAAPIPLARPLRNQPEQRLRTPGDNGTATNDWVLILAD